MKTKHKDHYEYIKATVSCDGDLRLRYKSNDCVIPGNQGHDESVADWTDREIETLVKNLLCVEKDDPVKIEVIHQ